MDTEVGNMTPIDNGNEGVASFTEFTCTVIPLNRNRRTSDPATRSDSTADKPEAERENDPAPPADPAP